MLLMAVQARPTKSILPANYSKELPKIEGCLSQNFMGKLT